MDKELTEKMERLIARMEREDKRASSSFVVSIICRILITLLVVCSLTFILVKFSAAATPGNMAIVINEKIRDSIPAVHAGLQAELPQQAKLMADSTVDLIHKSIPMMGDLVESQLATRFDQIMEHYTVQREKMFEHICTNVIEKVRKDKDIVKNHVLTKVLAAQLADECNREVREVINNAFLNEIDKLQVNVEKLRSTPDKAMTRSQAAKKHLIACWIYLVDNKSVEQEGIIGSTAAFMGEAVENFISSQN